MSGEVEKFWWKLNNRYGAYGFLDVWWARLDELELSKPRAGALSGTVGKVEKLNENWESLELKLCLELLDE